MTQLSGATVMIVGVGGVGSWTVEALARTGVGNLVLVDLDEVCINNVNRQLPAIDDTVGRPKVEVLRERVAAINPDCNVTADQRFFTARTADEMLGAQPDVVVDAIDTHRHKVLLISECRARGIALVVAGGAGGRRDPTRLRADDLSRTTNDPLLRNVRRDLRRHHGFSRQGEWRVPAVFSTEQPWYPQPDGTVCRQASGDGPDRLDCATGYGTAAHITGAFGFALAGLAVDALLTRRGD